MNKTIFAAALVAATGLAASSFASADAISIGLQETGVNGGAITTVGTGNGVAGVTGVSYGTFDVNNISVLGTPPLQEPDLTTTSVNTTFTGGTLKVYVTEQGISSSGNFDLLSGFTLNNLIGSGIASVSEATYIDASNGLYATTSPLGSSTFTAIGTADTLTDVNLVAPYSLTAVYTISDISPNASCASSAFGCTTTATITVQSVPEPATLAMFATGLLGCALVLRRRRSSES